MLLVLALGCYHHEQPLVVRTSEGRVFPVRFLGRVILGRNLTHAPVLRLEYVTKLVPSDSPELRAEALTVFQAWRPQLEKEGYRFAALSAGGPAAPNGARTIYTYVFERDPGGPWHSRLLGNYRPGHG